MKFLFLFLISLNANAGLHKLLVVGPNGEQAIEQVGETGKYNGGPTLWDESKDGPLPSDLVLGAMAVDSSGEKKLISVDESKRAAAIQKAADAVAAAEAAKATENTARAACAGIKAKIMSDTATAAEVRSAVKCLLRQL